ncbi:MAG TPA: hypothetical protein DC060_14190 [Gemmatimonadetes bacterium]|nr:hypothetical protein [Gemmatimonadota bacterium]
MLWAFHSVHHAERHLTSLTKCDATWGSTPCRASISGTSWPKTILLHGHQGLAATIGTLRPAIVLGHDVAEMPESHLRSVVIHELEHIRRGDFLANLLASVAMLLYWPNPLLYNSV